jgi:hypothetical protein
MGDRSYNGLMRKKRRSSANVLKPTPGPQVRVWRQRVGGTLMICAIYGPVVALPEAFYELDWHLFGSVHFQYGDALSLLPGIVITALIGPHVGYRRRDGLTILFPPRGIRIAWTMGMRLGRLPHRDWPERINGIELQGRQSARMAAAAVSYRRWRRRRAESAAEATFVDSRSDEQIIRIPDDRPQLGI